MAYEVFSSFSLIGRCKDIHKPHQTLDEVTRCFAQIEQPEGGIVVHPSTGKCIHAISAVAPDGTQRAFTEEELRSLDALSIDRRIVLEDLPNVTTFAYVADFAYAALLTIPHIAVELKGFFDYETRGQHYWNTEEGLGQSLAYIQQALFTLELCLKALLETTGQLVKIPDGKWKQHPPTTLFKLLNRETRRRVEQLWAQLLNEEKLRY